MAVEPFGARRDLSERHPDLECDSCFLGKNTNWANAFDQLANLIEQLANLARLSGKVVVDSVNSAGMRLVAVRKVAPALVAVPERRAIALQLEWPRLPLHKRGQPRQRRHQAR